eukprot:5370853-Prymnesium_polylepis.1
MLCVKVFHTPCSAVSILCVAMTSLPTSRRKLTSRLVSRSRSLGESSLAARRRWWKPQSLTRGVLLRNVPSVCGPFASTASCAGSSSSRRYVVESYSGRRRTHEGQIVGVMVLRQRLDAACCGKRAEKRIRGTAGARWHRPRASAEMQRLSGKADRGVRVTPLVACDLAFVSRKKSVVAVVPPFGTKRRLSAYNAAAPASSPTGRPLTTMRPSCRTVRMRRPTALALLMTESNGSVSGVNEASKPGLGKRVMEVSKAASIATQ